MNGHPIGVPDLGQRPGVPFHEQRIIMPAGLDIVPNGLSQGDSTWHLRIVDVAHGVAWLVPFNDKAGRIVAQQILNVVDRSNDAA